jgi:thiamine-phosphate pyrophosphorylase
MKKASRFGPWPVKTKNGLPTLWLFTDMRAPLDFSQLPRGAGVIIRHYDHPQRAIFARALVRAGHARGLVMLVAGDRRLALSCGADGVHLPEHQVRHLRRPHQKFCVTAAAHSAPALYHARHADGVFLSPIFTTRSHPGGKTLGRLSAGLLRHASKKPVFALGGITPVQAKSLAALGFSGIAAIDGWMDIIAA